MENFIVSARKYRPPSFNMVVGQDSITNTLKSAILNNHLAHAYLFCGPRGVGKTTCARIFAKAINCSNLKPDGEACDECESCSSFNSSRSFNIHELDAASNNKADDIRNLTDQVRVPPQIGKYSVYIIDEVHMLSSTAFNAFLKTLEEPPSHAIFILATTEKHKIIPTILSRCQIFDFNRIRVEDIVARLAYVARNESVEAEEEALHIIAQKADGALRDALSIFDQIVSLSGKKLSYRDVIENLNVLDFEYYFKTVDSALRGDVPSVLMIFNEILEKGFDGHNFVAGLSSHLRDLLVSRDEVTLRLLEVAPSLRQRYRNQSAGSPVGFLYRALDILSNCDLSFRTSKNQRLHVELALIKLCMIISESAGDPQKKNSEPDLSQQKNTETPVSAAPVTPVAREQQPQTENRIHQAHTGSYGKVQKPDTRQTKSVSIRDLISDTEIVEEKTAVSDDVPPQESTPGPTKELTPEVFNGAWKQFTGQLTDEGPRIVSMFNTVKPEITDDKKIIIHLSNADQKDVFVQQYKQRLLSFLNGFFKIDNADIESVVDVTEAAGVPYSDDQKFTYLASKYPALKDIKKSLNLDIP